MLITPPSAPKVDASCIILAGGESRRMGENKAFVRIADVSMFDHVFGACRKIFSEIVVATKSPEQFKNCDALVVTDKIEKAGPLGGLYTSLLAARHSHAFCIACDMPLINERLIRHLLKYRFYYDAVVPRIQGFPEPLHAVYSKQCIPMIEKCLERGILKALAFLDVARVLYCDDSELMKIDPFLASFTNVNTREQLRRVAEQWPSCPTAAYKGATGAQEILICKSARSGDKEAL